MGCQTKVTIGNNLTFSVTCHDPDTGVLTDADAAPPYRVYEEETAVAILTGKNMAKLDDANTTGFYSEQIACTTANGFEVGKSYNVYIEATVDSDTGGISYGFTVVADFEAQLAAILAAILRSPVVASLEADTLTLLRGDSYDSDDDNPIEDLGDISTRTALWFTAKRSLEQEDAAAIIQITEDDGLLILNGAAYGTAAHGVIAVTDAVAGDITITIDEAATALLVPGGIEYDIQWLSAAGNVRTVRRGNLTITADVTRAIA